ncbi:PX domain containing 1 [Columba livia]|uniref:PX domain containing 1 n=1 Tax=Columba livia TaxID=8932 RepID=A0A2I0MXV4_COLLI|nr:PX domain-containing protein 1 [Columba livia]PKK34508.1 PX domain containing 1 [Columba livia]
MRVTNIICFGGEVTVLANPFAARSSGATAADHGRCRSSSGLLFHQTGRCQEDHTIQLSQPPGLITIKEAHDIEARLNEVEKLLKTIINMPWKYSRSEVVLTFFERSPLDQVLKNDNVHKIQPSFQSPVKISEIMRSNGFCLANTETIVIDHSIPNGKEKHLDVDSAEHLFESVSDFTSELEDSDDPTAYVTNLTYYHLVPFETDILD